MCFHVQIKLLRVTVSSAQVRSVPATTCAKYTIYRARPQFVKLSEMLRDDGWMDGWMLTFMLALWPRLSAPPKNCQQRRHDIFALFSFSDLSWICVSLEYSFLAGLNDYCHCQ